jgi:hypothetical protein
MGRTRWIDADALKSAGWIGNKKSEPINKVRFFCFLIMEAAHGLDQGRSFHFW